MRILITASGIQDYIFNTRQRSAGRGTVRGNEPHLILAKEVATDV